MTALLKSQTHNTRQTILHVAARLSNANILVCILDELQVQGGDIIKEVLLSKDSDGYIPLHLMARYSNAETLSCILTKFKALGDCFLKDVLLAHDKAKNTVLYLAAEYNSAAAVSCILTILQDLGLLELALAVGREKCGHTVFTPAMRNKNHTSVVQTIIDQLPQSLYESLR